MKNEREINRIGVLAHNGLSKTLRTCLYAAGRPVSELARLQVTFCFSGHSFVIISLPLYACWAGPPCRDPGYRLPVSRLERASFSQVIRRNRPARPWRTCSITFGTRGPACTHSFFWIIERARKHRLVLWILHKKWRHVTTISRAYSGLAYYRISHINPGCFVGEPAR